MSDKPTEQSTRPDGNTPLQPSQLERGIGANVKKALQNFPDQRKRLADVVARKQRGEDGHARE